MCSAWCGLQASQHAIVHKESARAASTRKERDVFCTSHCTRSGVNEFLRKHQHAQNVRTSYATARRVSGVTSPQRRWPRMPRQQRDPDKHLDGISAHVACLTTQETMARRKAVVPAPQPLRHHDATEQCHNHCLSTASTSRGTAAATATMQRHRKLPRANLNNHRTTSDATDRFAHLVRTYHLREPLPNFRCAVSSPSTLCSTYRMRVPYVLVSHLAVIGEGGATFAPRRHQLTHTREENHVLKCKITCSHCAMTSLCYCVVWRRGIDPFAVGRIGWGPNSNRAALALRRPWQMRAGGGGRIRSTP